MAEILYLMQEADDREVARTLRRRLDHKIRAVPAGEDAGGLRADLALVDIRAADGEVFDILGRLCDAGIPVVAWSRESNNGRAPVSHEALALGCVGFIPRPAPDDMALRIEGFLQGHRDALGVKDRLRALKALNGASRSRLVEANKNLRHLLDQRELWFHSAVHELRSAAAWVAIYASMLEEGREVAGERTGWDHLRSGLLVLERRIADLEAFSEAETGRLSVDVKVLGLASLVRAWAERHGHGCDACTLRTSLQPVKVEGDRGRLMQVVDNLVDNAHKFTALTGRDPEIEVRVERRATWAVLEVLDNGPGVPAGQMETLFQPFRRLKSAPSRCASGMGLGLFVVRTIARAHGGDVSCSDNPRGPGSRFTVRLPVRGGREA